MYCNMLQGMHRYLEPGYKANVGIANVHNQHVEYNSL